MRHLSEDLYRKILDENIRLHAIEAPYYEKLHPEEFNWFEQARVRRDLRFIKRQLSDNPVALDIGCGTGNIFLKLLDMGCEVWGVDISEEMLGALRKRIPAEFNTRVKLFSKDIDRFLDNTIQQFDIITMSSVLHHLPEYIQTLRKTIGRLKKGGFIYIIHEPTEKALSPDRFLRKILWQADNLAYSLLNFGALPRTEARDYRFSDYQIYHGFDEEEVISVCRSAGLEIVEFERYSSAMRLGLSCWVDCTLLKSKGQFRMIVKSG